jgi:hypothetical protein
METTKSVYPFVTQQMFIKGKHIPRPVLVSEVKEMKWYPLLTSKDLTAWLQRQSRKQ